MIADAGYINDNGKYVEELTYFFFDELTEKEKQEILKNEYEQSNTEYDSAA